LMRLHMRTVRDTEPSLLRSANRFAIQHGWLLFAALTLNALYASSGQGRTLATFAVAAVLGAASVLGWVAALCPKRRQALHDLLTATQVLVNTRQSFRP